MSALGDRGITLEGLAAAVDALRQELATWKALARKQDALSVDQITATQSGATAAKISQIAVNTAAIQSLAAQVAGQISLAYVTTLPATGEPLTLYLVPQGDGTAPNFCNEYLWINDAWELIGTTGAMANNGELTIQVNGVAVGTFTANQATNSAVNITVPTNTNQLVNGAGYVDTAALQAALLLKQNNLNPAQLEAVNSGITAAAVQQIADNADAIAGKQDALTAAQQAAVDSGATAAKIDQIAANASAIVSLTSSKQDSLSTTQLAAVNSGVTSAAVQQIGANASNISSLQTAVASKAADSDVVHKAGAETITGGKEFASGANLTVRGYRFVVKNDLMVLGTVPSSNQWTGLQFVDSNNSPISELIQSFQRNGNTLYQLNVYPNEADSVKRTILGYSYNSAVGANYVAFSSDLVPQNTNTYSLGTSSNKWKTLNGINPGALSFPNNSAAIDISANISDRAYGSNSFVAVATGWISVNSFATAIQIADDTTEMAITGLPGPDGYAAVFLPVRAGDSIRILINQTSTTFQGFKLYPCLGNV